MATEASRNLNVVGQFIRQKREAAGLSQRALGQLFEPPVTTQFISNIERGVTPLPPAHISTITRALKISEEELMHTLEREYSLKISHRVGRPELAAFSPTARSPVESHDTIRFEDAADRLFFVRIYEAYRNSDENRRRQFQEMSESVLGLTGPESGLTRQNPPTGESTTDLSSGTLSS